MNDNLNPYTVLGVTTTATPAEITHAFRAKLRALHPDTGSAAVGDTQLRQVLAAYGLLRDPDRRADYDRTANLTPAPPPPRSSGPSAPRRTRPNPAGPVQIPVTYHRKHSQGPPDAGRPLWAGPVRRHP
jgi:curved DNA-binding protein CbpA